MNFESSATKRIYWLASYPKSGNTWFRTFLCNLQNDNDESLSINQLSIGSIGITQEGLDNELGFSSADLYQWEVDRLRPTIYNWRADQSEAPRYHKIHDACWQLDSGQWLVSEAATAGALYFLRNPLDVAISYANHLHSSIDEAIMRMGTLEHCLGKNKHNSLIYQTEQRLFTWSKHVISWVDNPVIDTCVIRYEDMKHRPEQTFTSAVNYLKLSHDPDRINKALHFSSFEVMQQQESLNKFRECPSNTARFFRKGIAGDWQKVLTTSQIDQIINDHHEVMLRFGYLDAAGNPQIM